MTFLVAFARKDFALLASDTRTTYHSTPFAPHDGFNDDEVKIRPCDNGWLASGPSLYWRDVVLQAYANRDNNAYTRAMRELETEQPEMARRIAEAQQTVRIGVNATGCFRQYFNWLGLELADWLQPPVPQHVPLAIFPTRSSPAALEARFDTFRSEIDGASLPAILRATARLYEDVYAHCGPAGCMSPFVTVGVVWPDGRRTLVGPLHHDIIKAASDDVAAELLTPEVSAC